MSTVSCPWNDLLMRKLQVGLVMPALPQSVREEAFVKSQRALMLQGGPTPQQWLTAVGSSSTPPWPSGFGRRSCVCPRLRSLLLGCSASHDWTPSSHPRSQTARSEPYHPGPSPHRSPTASGQGFNWNVLKLAIWATFHFYFSYFIYSNRFEEKQQNNQKMNLA